VSNVILAEQKLAVEIADFNVIIVSALDFAIWSTADAHQRESFDELTTKCARTNHEGFNIS
jgi:hypothetical protein